MEGLIDPFGHLLSYSHSPLSANVDQFQDNIIESVSVAGDTRCNGMFYVFVTLQDAEQGKRRTEVYVQSLWDICEIDDTQQRDLKNVRCTDDLRTKLALTHPRNGASAEFIVS